MDLERLPPLWHASVNVSQQIFVIGTEETRYTQDQSHLNTRCDFRLVWALRGVITRRPVWFCWLCIVTPRITETVIELPNLQLSHKVGSNQVVEVWNQNSNEKSEVQTPAIMVLKAYSRNFGEFMKLVFTLITKHKFILESCYSSMQIHKIPLCQ
jgi:hypothetical protein